MFYPHIRSWYLFKNFKLLHIGGLGEQKSFSLSLKYLIWSITRSRLIASVISFVLAVLRPLSFWLVRSHCRCLVWYSLWEKNSEERLAIKI